MPLAVRWVPVCFSADAGGRAVARRCLRSRQPARRLGRVGAACRPPRLPFRCHRPHAAHGRRTDRPDDEPGRDLAAVPRVQTPQLRPPAGLRPGGGRARRAERDTTVVWTVRPLGGDLPRSLLRIGLRDDGRGSRTRVHAWHRSVIRRGPPPQGVRGAVTRGGRRRRLPASVLGRRAPTGAHVHRSAGCDTPHERRDPVRVHPEGDKYLSWIRHEGAQHPVFEGETRACFAAIHHQILCDDMQAWLGSAIRAFLDAYVRDEAVAAAYLGT